MESIDLYREIEHVLSPEESIQVTAALRHDPLVWQSLQQPGFLHLVIEGAGNQAGCWSPGQLSLLTLTDTRPGTLRAEPLIPLEHALQEKSLRIYQAVQRSSLPPATLSEAGLLALALRERRRLTGTWSGLLAEILPKPNQASTLFPVWRTALACLYAFVPDPEDMLRGLLPKTMNHMPIEWLILSQLAQPMSQQEHIEAFTRILKGLSVPFQLGALRSLSLHGNESIAGQVADQLLVGHSAFSNLRVHNPSNEMDHASLSSRAIALQQMGTYYQITGDFTQALSLFSAAETAIQQWLAGLYLQCLNLRANDTKIDSSVLMGSQQLSQLASAAGWLKDDLGAVLISNPYASTIIDQVTEDQESPFLSLKRASLLSDQEPALAHDLAHQAYQAIFDQVKHHGMPFEGEHVYSWRPQDAILILLDLGMEDEALSLLQVLLETRPVDVKLLHLGAEILDRLDRKEGALNFEYSAVVLDPKNPIWHRGLAILWGKTGNWSNSFDEWKIVLSLSEQVMIEDKQSCAQAALLSGALDDAAAMSESILDIDQNNGVALGILGQALIAREELQPAIGCLVRATLLTPDILAPWLALAKAQRDVGEPQRAVETLRAAVIALPDSYEAHLALGQACDEVGLLAEGLPNFKTAYMLSPDDNQVALHYSKALRRLGHSTEARAVLDKMRSSWQECPELAYEYARVLIDQNEPEAALPVLEVALHNGLPILDGHLLYAKVLLSQIYSKNEIIEAQDPATTTNKTSRLQQAEQVLLRVLRVDPENLEARFLKADIMREKGNLEEALVAYRQLADLLGSDTDDLSWRVQWGMAQTALCLNRTDTALAAYKEACQVRPDHILLRRGLAEASLLASLPQEAMEAADQVLQLASDDVDNLAWYAEFAARLGENEKAVFALERAVQIDPLRPDLLVDLAQWQMSAGDLDSARDTLETVSSMQTYREGLRGNFMRRAAQMYLRMQDPQSAIACYERALTLDTTQEYSLYFEVAELQERMGNLEMALDLAQKAHEKSPENISLILLQADLLSRLNRPQAAMALLERALKIVNGDEANTNELTEFQREKLSEIHKRFTDLMLQEGNITEALYHSENALALHPEKADLAYRTADLALSIIQIERAKQVLESTLVMDTALPQAMVEKGSDGINLLCLHIETALLNGQEQQASVWLEDALRLIPNVPRLLAIKSRILARHGEYSEAEQVYADMVRMLKKDHSTEPASDCLWLAESALETRIWSDALSFAEKYSELHPYEARAALLLAKTLVKAAEYQHLCDDLGCIKKAPGPQVLNGEYLNKFSKAIQSASELANVGEIGRWQARGQVAFTPSSHSVKILAAMPSDPEDVAALIGVLRQLNNRSAAIQVSRRYSSNGHVLLQLALCHMKEDPIEGLAIAEQAVQATPKDFLAQAAVAHLAVQASAISRAIEAYEKALELSSGEPEWHDGVGDLFIQTGKVQQALWHRQQAVEFDPDNAQYAYKLGQTFLSMGDTAGAVEFLERSTVLDSQRAESWLALAGAYHIAGRLPQAMEAAKQAGVLNPSSAEGLLVAGETALALNQVDQALELAKNAVRREPDNSSAYLFLSGVLTMQGKENESLALLEGASAQVKSVYPVAIERAKLIHKVHGPQAALEVLEKLVKDYPEEADLISLIASIEAECGDEKAAERYAFKALRLEPNQPDLTLMLGKLQRKSGQLDQAVHLLSEVIRMAPDTLEAYIELASVYQERREFIQALQVYRQAMRVSPNDFQAYYQSGLIMRDSKDYSSAEAMLRKAAELAPDNLSIRRQLVGVIALNLVHSKQEVSV